MSTPLVQWAQGFSPSVRGQVGAISFWLREHRVDEGDEGGPALGVQVQDEASGQVALWHEASQLYGFARLPAGTRRFLFTHPQGRYLPRAYSAEVMDRSAALSALNLGQTPSEDRAEVKAKVFRQALMRPSILYPVPPGQTLAWGEALTADGDPAPYAYVHLTLDLPGEDARSWTTTADAQGLWVVWLRGLSATALESEELPCTLSLRRRELGTDETETDLLPADFDALSSADVEAWYPLASADTPLTLPLAQRTRVDPVSIP